MSTAIDIARLAGAWRADVTHSSITFAVRHLGISMFRGEVTDFDVVLSGDAALRGTGRVASIVTRDDTLWGKPVAVIGASTGSFGRVQAQQDLRRVLKVAGARVLEDARLAVPRAHEQVAEDGTVRSEAVRAGLGRVLEMLVATGDDLDRAA